MNERRGEFDLIARYFGPLAGPESLQLGDDAAILTPPPGESVVVTCDMMVAGVHFLPHDPPDAIGAKLLAVNLSDLAAMGADPAHYFLAAAWPEPPADAWLDGFCSGLRQMQDRHGLSLAGGDTTRTDGPMTLTVTAIGYVPAGQAVLRSTARANDLIFVSGTVGDAALALHLAMVGSSGSMAGVDALRDRLWRPTPRLALGRSLRGIASAMVDVSDGLIGDLDHIARQSACGAVVRAVDVPISPQASDILATDPDLMRLILSGGDDYELLFTAPSDRRAAILSAAEHSETPVAEIGAMRAESGIDVIDRAGNTVLLPRSGYRHF